MIYIYISLSRQIYLTLFKNKIKKFINIKNKKNIGGDGYGYE